MTPECLDRADLAKLLKVSSRQIYRLAAAGKLPAPIQLGTSKRWLAEEVHEWLRAGAPPRRAWENLRSALADPRNGEGLS